MIPSVSKTIDEFARWVRSLGADGTLDDPPPTRVALNGSRAPENETPEQPPKGSRASARLYNPPA